MIEILHHTCDKKCAFTAIRIMDIRILSLILTQRGRDEFNLTRFIIRHVIRIYVSESCTSRYDVSACLQTD